MRIRLFTDCGSYSFTKVYERKQYLLRNAQWVWTVLFSANPITRCRGIWQYILWRFREMCSKKSFFLRFLNTWQKQQILVWKIVSELWLCRILCRVAAEIALQLEGHFPPRGNCFLFCLEPCDLPNSWQRMYVHFLCWSLHQPVFSSRWKQIKISFRVCICVIICIASRTFVVA